MDTALITGMFETSFIPEKRVELDVRNESTGSFGKIFESSLKDNEVSVKNTEVKEDVDSEQLDMEETIATEEKTDDIEETKDDVKTEGKNKIKDKKTKESNYLDNFSFQNEFKKMNLEDNSTKNDLELKIEDVESLTGVIKNEGTREIDIEPEEKLNNLLSKLDVEFSQNVEIKDNSERVSEVGPHGVETEKIELNIKDVELKQKDVEQKLNQENIIVSNEENINDPTIQNPFKLKLLDKNQIEEDDDVDTEGSKNNTLDVNINDVNNNDVKNNGLNNKDSNNKDSNKKEDKIKIKDFRNTKEVDFNKEIFSNEDVKIENKFEIKDVNHIEKFENFVEQDVLDQITEKLEVSLFDNKSEMVIKLKPHDLGNVTVKISIENGVMNAKFLADSIKVKETLESNLNNLKESLKDQGLSVQDLSVSVDSGRSQNQTFEQSNLRYFNNKKDYKIERTESYEDTYYEFSNNNNINNVRSYWMDSTVSFLA